MVAWIGGADAGRGVSGAEPRGTGRAMALGTSLFLIAAGAILKFAVTAEVANVDVQTVGVILMLVGALGLVLALFMMLRPETRTAAGRDPYDRQGPSGYDRRV